jgi:Ca2+ transporting ATPase
MADRALRTICFAYKDIGPNEDLEKKDHLGVFDLETNNLIILAILGIADVVRPEVPKAIDNCRTAGITVRMITGDNIDTARAIARECGLIQASEKEAMVIEG